MPEGSNQSAAALARHSDGRLAAASHADEKSLEDFKVLLNAEGTGGGSIQARDGTLLVTSTIPAGPRHQLRRTGRNRSRWTA